MRTERLRRRQRGAAMVEAVIALPVLALIWVSLYYLGDLFASQQSAQTQARTCAWLYSQNNCESIPPACEGVLSKANGSAEVAPDVQNALKDGADQALRGGDSKGIVGAIVGNLVAGPLLEAFTSGADARTVRSVKQPAEYGVGTSQVVGRYHLACNLAPTTPEDMAKKAWSSLVNP